MPRRLDRRAYQPPSPMAGYIYATRIKLGMTLQRFGKAVGVDHPVVSRWEMKGEVPSLIHLLRIGALSEGPSREFFVEAARKRIRAGFLSELGREQMQALMHEVAFAC